MTPVGQALACADAGASLRMTNKNNNFIDTCRLLGNYNGENIIYIHVLNMIDQEFFILQITFIYLNGQMLIN